MQVWRAPRIEDRWRVKLPRGEHGKYIKLGLQEEQILDLKHVFVYETGS